mmetsp:Transcript_49707/g.50090  ORF Transcript_49707/g.50090 Transcript_49707/m.50090 type:complete len:90 (-) Transcript_49707:1271-1540(-)
MEQQDFFSYSNIKQTNTRKHNRCRTSRYYRSSRLNPKRLFKQFDSGGRPDQCKDGPSSTPASSVQVSSSLQQEGSGSSIPLIPKIFSFI